MKKLIFKAMPVAIVLLLFLSCETMRKKTDTLSAEKPSSIEMKAFPERNTGAPDTLVLTIRNNTAGVIQFGANYSIERLSGKEWTRIDFGDFAVIAVMYDLQPGDSASYKINLYPEKASYPVGDYRVVKQVFQSGKDMEPYYAGFRIVEPH